MTLVVACSLPSGLAIDHGGKTVSLNGAHVGIDPEMLPKNGMINDTELRGSGFGLTTLSDAQADTFLAWVDTVTMRDGQPLQEPFAPIATGAIIWAKSEKDARAEAKNKPGTGIPGIDPEKELPKEGLEPATKD